MYRSLSSLALAALACGLIPSTALAIVHSGNPNVAFHVSASSGVLLEGDVDLDKVRVNHCDGSFVDYQVNGSVDPVLGFELNVGGGDLCSVTYYWGSDMLLDGDDVDGLYTIAYQQGTTTVYLPDTVISLAPWIPITGIVHSGNPNFHLSVD